MDGQQQYADAMRAFDAYYGARQAAYGVAWPAKRYAEHRAWKAFLKVAAQCAKEGRDVERFVSVVVGRLTKNSDEVVPNDLLTKRAEELWMTYKDVKTAGAADKWAYFVRLVMQIQRATEQSDEAILLTALNAQFPAWFRVLYPETLNDRIVSSWGEDALADLRGDRDLVRFLRAAMAGKMESFEKKMGVIDGL